MINTSELLMNNSMNKKLNEQDEKNCLLWYHEDPRKANTIISYEDEEGRLLSNCSTNPGGRNSGGVSTSEHM